jgi:hypothetical protein
VQKFDHIGMIQTFMYLDFAHQLHRPLGYFEFGALLNEGRLLDNLDSEDILGLLCDEFIASGEPTLAQEIALDVLGNSVGLETVVLDDV